MPDPLPDGWGTCPTCGDATPPGATACPTCGKILAPPPPPGSPAPTALRRRLVMHRTLRIVLVSAVAIGLAGVMLLAIYQGPPVAADPLTGTWTFHLAPRGNGYFQGSITGGDYIAGNFSVIDPPGALTTFLVFNATEFPLFESNLTASPALTNAPVNNGIIDFSPQVTDTYYFVFVNHYPASSHIAISVFVKTEYMSNVVVE